LVAHAILTRSPLVPAPEGGSPLDLHVLGAPPAFILSQDRTLRSSFAPPSPGAPRAWRPARFASVVFPAVSGSQGSRAGPGGAAREVNLRPRAPRVKGGRGLHGRDTLTTPIRRLLADVGISPLYYMHSLDNKRDCCLRSSPSLAPVSMRNL
jgi:hypothetical protein